MPDLQPDAMDLSFDESGRSESCGGGSKAAWRAQSTSTVCTNCLTGPSVRLSRVSSAGLHMWIILEIAVRTSNVRHPFILINAPGDGHERLSPNPEFYPSPRSGS